MRVRWTVDAFEDLSDIADFIAKDNDAAAMKIATTIYNEVESLGSMPRRGHQGREPGTLDWRVKGTSYVIAYDILDNEVVILRVYHGARGNRR